MNREMLRRLTHAHRKPGDLNRASTHEMKTKMGMGSKVRLREAINQKLGLKKEDTDGTENITRGS